jgi:two-component system response regulator YesN
MALKVLIADDEELAREGLETLVSGLDGFRVVATAQDGESAVDLAHSTQPHICILDVKMPRLNGLEALEAIKTASPATRCIIYSGHDEFTYAQSAIKLKADDYLLKPASQDALEEALRRVRDEVESAEALGADGSAPRRQLEHGLAAVEEVFYRGLVAGDMSLEDLEEQKEIIGADTETARVIILSLDDSHQIRLEKGDAQVQTLRTQLRAVSQRVCTRKYHGRVPLFFFEGDVLLLLDDNLFCSDFPKFLRHELQLAIQRDVSLSVGDAAPLAHASRSYLSARHRLSYRLTLGGRRVFGPDDDSIVDSGQARMPESTLATLKKSVRYTDRDAVDMEIASVFAFLKAHVSDPDSWRRFCFEIYENCHFLVRECVPDLQDHLSSIEVSRTLERVSTATELEEWLRSSLGRLVDVLETRCQSYSLALKKALDYIDRNFTCEFTLRDLAEYVQLNPSYLSNLISRESGKTFVEHVTERRMGRAKELLSKGDLNVSEIAYELGYETPRYFSMVFKKTIGMTPSEFRQTASGA